MDEILSRCGYRCDLCMAYRPNVEDNPDGRRLLSDGWFKYFGFRIPAEMILCDGCREEKETLLDKDCPVRPCVIEHGFHNCAECKDFACEKINQRLVTIEEIQSKFNTAIPEEERRQFILPYENKTRLEKIRQAKK